MKCAYCKKNIRVDPYQGEEAEEHSVEINGIPVKVHLHSDCIDQLIGRYLSGVNE